MKMESGSTFSTRKTETHINMSVCLFSHYRILKSVSHRGLSDLVSKVKACSHGSRPKAHEYQVNGSRRSKNT